MLVFVIRDISVGLLAACWIGALLVLGRRNSRR